MNTPANRVTVHHEGAGIPRVVHLAPYTYVIHPDGTFERIQSVFTSWATLNFNHVSCDIVLPGDRDVYPVTAVEIAGIGAACADARARGELVDQPYVIDHHDSPGSNTVCPGTHTREPLTWMAIVNACHKEAPAPMPAQAPEFFPPLSTVSFCAFTHPTLGACAAAIDADGHVFTSPKTAYLGSPFDDHTGKPKPYWSAGGVQRFGAKITAAKSGTGYVIEDTAKELYGPTF